MEYELFINYHPCHRIKSLICSNFYIEMSAAKAACLPSLPSIPIPIWDTRIIPTSLPPSPIEQTYSPMFL